MAGETVAEKDTGIYRAARVFAWILFHFFMPVRYHGVEKLKDREPPFVLISNHRHALDPLILAYPVPSQCFFLGKKELAKNAFLQKLMAGNMRKAAGDDKAKNDRAGDCKTRKWQNRIICAKLF